MKTVREIMNWLARLDPDANIAVDEDEDEGSLFVVGSVPHDHLEIGYSLDPECDVEPGDTLMTVDEFLADAECGDLDDYDGYGVLATETRKSSITVQPSDAAEVIAKHRDTWTHVVWYNR